MKISGSRVGRKSCGVVLVGFGGYRGSVIAGREWGEPMERQSVPAARPGSWEAVLHDALGEDSLLVFPAALEADAPLHRIRGHRAIGVVYDPEGGRGGGYVPTALARRYDAFIYLEDTHPLHPLHIEAGHQTPDTYPWGI